MTWVAVMVGVCRDRDHGLSAGDELGVGQRGRPRVDGPGQPQPRDAGGAEVANLPAELLAACVSI